MMNGLNQYKNVAQELNILVMYPQYESKLHKELRVQIKSKLQPHQNQISPQPHHFLNPLQLKSFKTKQCFQSHHESADHYQLNHHLMESPYYYNCIFYHSVKDRRRQTQKQNNYPYRGIYVGDGFSKDTCNNWIQYLYHPDVYKTVDCQSTVCRRLYCPKVHKGEKRKSQEQQDGQKDRAQQKQNQKFNVSAFVEQFKEIKRMSTNPDQVVENKIINKARSSIHQYIQKISKFELNRFEKQVNLQAQIKNLANNGSKNLQNLKNEEDYEVLFYNEQLKIVQDRQHEFKMFKDKDPRIISALVLQYISAFLNSDGGSIYLGVNNQSFVHGIEVSQTWLDQFKLSIDSDGRNHLNPPLIPQKYDLRIIPVNHPKKSGLKVVQIKVFPQIQAEKKLTLYKKECYVRMNASNHRFSASDIMQYMRIMNNKKDLEVLSRIEDRIEEMEVSEVKDLSDTIQRLSRKVNLNKKKDNNQISTN